MKQSEVIAWVMERTAVRGVRYVARGRDGWQKSGGGLWPLQTDDTPPAEQADGAAEEGGTVVDADKPLARAVREAKDALGAPRQVVLALPLSRLLVQIMRFPSEMRDDLPGAVALQMDKLSPFADEDLSVSHEVLSEGETDIWVLGAAMPTVVFEEIGTALQLAKLHIARTDIASLGWFRSLCGPLNLMRPGRRVLLMDMDDGWDLVVVDHGVPVLMRGLGVIPDTETLIREITLSFLNAELEAGTQPPAEIMVISSTPLPPDQTTQITALLGAPVHHHLPPEVDGGADGVAIRTYEAATMDLTPAAWRDAVKEARVNRRVMTAVTAAAGIWVLLMATLFSVPVVYRQMTKRTSEQSAKHLKAYRQVADMRDRVQLIQSYMNYTNSALELLRIATVEHLPPQDITLFSFTYNKEDGIKVSGEADSTDLVYDYIESLKTDPLFESVTYGGLSATARGKQKFDIDAKFHGAQQKK
ncbi:MAG: hypothetical protein FWH21_01925 [Kiritimatiellaeota bacterium]|nr:hypothetical protein [Kiritimatiellota bacterium]